MKKFKYWLLGIISAIFLVFVLVIVAFKTLSFQLDEWEPLNLNQLKNNQAQQATPNILFIVAEDMSDRVGAFGDPLAATPNIDQLASQSVRYPNTFTTAGVCSPSRAALITGVHQISIGSQHMRTANFPEGGYKSVPPPHIKAFPELLRKAGYYTFNTSKLDYQFSGAMPGSGPFTIWDAENDPQLWRNRAKGQPFFGMINIMETHETGLFSPLGTKPNSFIHFAVQLMRAFGGYREGMPVDPAKVVIPPFYPDTPLIRADIARHYQNINAMDQIVGDLIAKLNDDGLLHSTIIIWTTDHGDCLPRAKRELFDSGIKVPMVIYWPEDFERPPGFEPGSENEKLISFVDLAPTFLSVTQAPLHDYLHGRSIFSDSSRAFVYASRDRIDEVQDRQRAIRNQRYKYIKSWHPDQPGGHQLKFRDNLRIMQELWRLKDLDQLNDDQLSWFNQPGEERLFDVYTDPFELNDLSEDPTYADTLDIMRKELENWITRVGDHSNISESDLVQSFQPSGKQESTPSPMIEITEDTVRLASKVPGASIGYRINRGAWQLYNGPFKIEKGSEITSKAVRYGWKESDAAEVKY